MTWIPVNERLPKNSKPVFVCNSKREIGFASFDPDIHQWCSQEFYFWVKASVITHWQPIKYPEPPKESE